ncbi:ABC transporter permease [Sporosarcina highlanderae]|uniref:ABC transporter permease n=1 Tax=Sporosarcina highlanderae TaxID=3035916 RepID=A0ABT8JM44_9BACL|nr:ABC transporter permease [Sporosarcina highlanderae]MDN4606205.1 ABC transporter permease [Sporosarcina highlanderae]
MKKFGLAIIGIVAAIVVLANLGSILGLAISALIAFAGVHYYRKSDSTFLKLFWGTVLVIGLLTAVTNIPAFIGIIALLGVYYVWRKWNENKNDNVIDAEYSDDPFVNFERQWDEITK